MQNKLRKAIHDVEEAEERSAMLETQLVRGGSRGGSSSSTTRITTRRVVSSPQFYKLAPFHALYR